MSEEETSNELAEERTENAEERTDLAEDRTLLANERTFAGWARTALAAIGLGLGFQALFQKIEPTWVAKAIASLFIALGVWVIWKAERRAHRVLEQNRTHEVRATSGREFRILAIVVTVGAATLLTCLWWLF